MKTRLKILYNRVSKIVMALSLLFFLLFLIFTLLFEGTRGELDSVSIISLTALVLSFPGMINTLSEEYNSTKKTYKLSCRCPNCKHLIQMDMKEE